MHALQRKAILALLGMVESAVREIRSVLSDGTPGVPYQEPAQPYMQSTDPYKNPHPEGALSDEEDDTLEQMMEKHRLSLLTASESLAARFYAESPSPAQGGLYDEEGS